MVRVDNDIAERHHSSSREVWALRVGFAIFDQAVQGEDSGRYKIVGL